MPKNTQKTPRKSTSPRPTATRKIEDESSIGSLAGHLSAVLNHPELPLTLRNHIGEAMTELYSGLSFEQQSRIDNDPTRLAFLLEAYTNLLEAAYTEDAKGDAR